MKNNCPLYCLQSKKQLKKLLNIPSNKYIKNKFQDEINIYIDKKDKPRLIEAPNKELKEIQSLIKCYLQKCDFPEYVFSGVKKRCYIDNANLHVNSKFLFKADISAFFPNISRNTIYRFFKCDLKVSPDIAKILTDLCTVDITNSINNNKEIDDFVRLKRIRQFKHLCTGSPVSPILSYLANKNMFDELNNIALKNNCIFSVYVDDIFFSSQKPISSVAQNKIIKVISKYGYNISKNKVTYYKQNEYKKVTGVIISPSNKLLVPNKLKKKIVENFSKGRYKVNYKSMQGLLYSAKHIEKDIFPNIHKHLLNNTNTV